MNLDLAIHGIAKQTNEIKDDICQIPVEKNNKSEFENIVYKTELENECKITNSIDIQQQNDLENVVKVSMQNNPVKALNPESDLDKGNDHEEQGVIIALELEWGNLKWKIMFTLIILLIIFGIVGSIIYFNVRNFYSSFYGNSRSIENSNKTKINI